MAQLPVPPMLVPTDVNVLLALLPRVVIAPMQTTIIRASMTAYSTAVGPSSALRNFTTFLANCRISVLLGKNKNGTQAATQLPVPPIVVPTLPNVLLALLPRVVI